MQINNCNDCNIKMVKGDTLAFYFEIEDLESSLTSAYFTVKQDFNDSNNLFQKSLNDGITQANDLYYVEVEPADTSSLDVGPYRYDLEVTFNGETHTILRGILRLENEVS